MAKKRKSTEICSDVMPDPASIRLGSLVSFVPVSFYHEVSATPKYGKPVYRSVAGSICYINRAHRYFTVVYKMGTLKFRESFKY